MGDEYDAAEADYWNYANEYDRTGFLTGWHPPRSDHHQHYGAAIPREHYRMMPEIHVNRGGIQFPTPSRQYVGDAEDSLLGLTPIMGEKVQNDQDLLTQAEELRDQAAKLERIVSEREKYGEDPFKNGSVLKVEMRYRTGSRRSFAYGVVKVAGKFYLSGKLTAVNNANGMDWAAFVAWLSQGDASVWQAKSLQQVF